MGQFSLPSAIGILSAELAALGRKTVTQAANRTTLTPKPAVGPPRGCLVKATLPFERLLWLLGCVSGLIVRSS